MTMTNNTTLTSARKIGFAILAAGVLTITSGIAAPQQAKAFGLGDITGYVEDVWEIGADATERVGRKIGKEARKIGRGTITPTRPNGRRRVSSTPVGGGNTALPPARRAVNSSALPPARGTAKPTGDRALPPPRRANQRPAPITEEDVRPPIITCNSKFENCSGNDGHHGGHGGHGHHDHSKKAKNNKAKNNNSRDKSVWGNPVGGTKTKRIKRNDKKVMIKRGAKKITVKRSSRTQMKQGNTQNIRIKRSNVRRTIKVTRKNNRRG